jgi:hypothetical protein
MALVTISGYPLSGKTTRVNQLRDYIQTKLDEPEYTGSIQKIVVVSDDSLNISRSVYDCECPLRPNFANDKQFRSLENGESCSGQLVHCTATEFGQEYSCDLGLCELHQGLSISNVLCGSRA